MEKELKNIISKEINQHDNQEYLSKISNEYFDYYFNQSNQVQKKFKKLIGKYNHKTILGYLGKNGYPEDYVHMSLGHEMGEKTLTPMLDNGGGIYPPDKEIGQIIKDPEYWTNEETDEEWELKWKLKWKFHELIFFSWLSINWIYVEGYKSKIVVKTTENNSVRAWYLNDFQFDENSKFDLEPNWRKAIADFNMKSIGIDQLIENIKKGIR